MSWLLWPHDMKRLDEQEMKNSSKGTYYKDPNLEVLVAEYDMDLGEVDMAELTCKNDMWCAKPYTRLPRALMALQLLRSKPLKLGRLTLLT